MYFTNPEIVMMKYGALLEMKFRNYSVHLWNNNMEPLEICNHVYVWS